MSAEPPGAQDLADARLDRVLAAIDAANADDPRKCVVDGREIAFEQLYSARMSAHLARIYAHPSALLRIAAHAQVIDAADKVCAIYDELIRIGRMRLAL